MGHEHQRHAACRLLVEQGLEHLLSGPAVEVAGGLVGDQDRRVQEERPGDRDALLLAARELRGPMAEAVGEAEARQHSGGAVEELGPVGAERPPAELDHGRQHGVLQGGELGQQVIELEDEADLLVTQVGAMPGAQAPGVLAGDADRALGRAVQQTQDVEQGGLPGAGGAHEREPLPGAELEVDAVQDLQPSLAHGE